MAAVLSTSKNPITYQQVANWELGRSLVPSHVLLAILKDQKGGITIGKPVSN